MGQKNGRGRRSGSSTGGQRTAVLPSATLVQTEEGYKGLLRGLEGQSWVAVDTESNSLFRYTPRVCLIQMTFAMRPGSPPGGSQAGEVVDYLIDPFQLPDLSDLGKILADSGTEVVLHAAENDLLTLRRDFDIRVRRLYDTQLAARILGRKGVGLAQILNEEFGVVSDKRMQRTNWGLRPLTQEQLTYAQIDTHYLPALRARLSKSLKEAGRWEEALAAFRMLEGIEYRPPEPRSFWQMKQIRKVATEDLGVLQAVWDWREAHSKRADRPPFKVLGENALVALAESRPRTEGELRRVQGVSQRQIDRFGRELLRAVLLGARQPIPERPLPPRRGEPPLNASGRTRYEALRKWRSETAAARGVDPDIVFSNETLMRIAANRPETVEALQAIPGVGEWKAKNYGQVLFGLLRNRG